MLLFDHDRARFSLYCHKQADADTKMADQMEKLGPAHAAMVKRLRARAAAHQIVAADLDSAEAVTVQR